MFWENTIVRRFCIRSTPLIDFLLPGGVPHQHGKEVRKRGSFGVVSWVSLLARFALLLIFDQDDVSRCQQVRPIVPRLFLTRKSARNDPPHASDISDFRRLLSRSLFFFSWWSHRYFSREKSSNIRICEYLSRDWAIKGRELSIELLIFCIFSFGVVFSFRRDRWLMIVEERWCMRDELVLEIVGFI